MKKKILGIALLAMSVFATTAVAQTPQATSTGCQTTCQSTGNCPQQPGKQRAPKYDPYEGMTLTEAQKTQLNELRGSKSQAKRQERAKADSARMAGFRNDRRGYLQKVKEIVGPEQYVIFLENMVVNGNPSQVMQPVKKTQGHKAKMRKDRKPGASTMAVPQNATPQQ